MLVLKVCRDGLFSCAMMMMVFRGTTQVCFEERLPAGLMRCYLTSSETDATPLISLSICCIWPGPAHCLVLTIISQLTIKNLSFHPLPF